MPDPTTSPAPSGIVFVSFTPNCPPPRPPSNLASQHPSTFRTDLLRTLSKHVRTKIHRAASIGASYLRTVHSLLLFRRWKHQRDDLGHADRWDLSLGCTRRDDIAATISSSAMFSTHLRLTLTSARPSRSFMHRTRHFDPLPSTPTLLYIHSRHRTVVSTR
jgi:hypothetical protein